jgi:GDP-L-fucose synthase
MQNSFWNSKRVLVTGGNGFLGGFVLKRLRDSGCREIFAPRKAEFDLRDAGAIQKLLGMVKPDVVIHLAAICGGIGANRERPGTFFYDNAIMGIQLIEQCRLHKVGKMVVLGTICAYPKITAVPFLEENLWEGYPEETNAPYGLAKKMLLVQLQAYRQQYGFQGVYLLPVNLYGPGDNFDLGSSHVIPALIRKMSEARDNDLKELTLWGTGTPSREFLFVRDCAEGIVLAAERYDKPEPVNLGVGMEIKISDLASLIRDLVGFRGEIRWDSSKPDGQPRRSLDTTRAEREFGFRASTNFEAGLRETVEWYQKNLQSPTQESP